MYQVQQLTDTQLSRVNTFYKRCRYPAKARRDEVVFVATDAVGIAAAVCLQPKTDGWYCLRSMCVAPERRRQGIGSQLLDGLTEFLNQHNSYCYAFAHLEDFYTRIGFERCQPNTAPAFMADAYKRYTQPDRNICLMLRRRPTA